MPSNKSDAAAAAGAEVRRIKLINYDFAKYGSSGERKRLLERWEQGSRRRCRSDRCRARRWRRLAVGAARAVRCPGTRCGQRLRARCLADRPSSTRTWRRRCCRSSRTASGGCAGAAGARRCAAVALLPVDARSARRAARWHAPSASACSAASGASASACAAGPRTGSTALFGDLQRSAVSSAWGSARALVADRACCRCCSIAGLAGAASSGGDAFVAGAVVVVAALVVLFTFFPVAAHPAAGLPGRRRAPSSPALLVDRLFGREDLGPRLPRRRRRAAASPGTRSSSRCLRRPARTALGLAFALVATRTALRATRRRCACSRSCRSSRRRS